MTEEQFKLVVALQKIMDIRNILFDMIHRVLNGQFDSRSYVGDITLSLRTVLYENNDTQFWKDYREYCERHNLENNVTTQTTSNCIHCGKPVKDYQPEYCCNGHECGCYGLPIHPPEHLICVVKNGLSNKEKVEYPSIGLSNDSDKTLILELNQRSTKTSLKVKGKQAILLRKLLMNWPNEHVLLLWCEELIKLLEKNGILE